MKSDQTPPLSDPLVVRATKGSDQAFAQLVTQNQQAVRAFVRRLTRHPADADDLAQEAFLTAWKNLGRLNPDVTFRTFVCAIAYRKVLNDNRRFQRAGQRETAWHDLQPDTETPAPELKISLETALQALPLDQRAAISLCVASDYSHTEAAEILGLPLGTVKSHIQRGRERLMLILKGDHHDA